MQPEWMCRLLVLLRVVECILLNNENQWNLPITARYTKAYIFFDTRAYKEPTFIWYKMSDTKWSMWWILFRLRNGADKLHFAFHYWFMRYFAFHCWNWMLTLVTFYLFQNVLVRYSIQEWDKYVVLPPEKKSDKKLRMWTGQPKMNRNERMNG